MQHKRRPKIFGPAPGRKPDRNIADRLKRYGEAYNRRHKQPRQHIGPITRATFDVLFALLTFRNYQTGACFPSYPAIAERAGVHEDTVCVAIKVLEAAEMLTWMHRLRRVPEYVRDLLGGWSIAGFRTLRSSNAYLFRPAPERRPDFPGGTPTSLDSKAYTKTYVPPATSKLLEQALALLGAAIAREAGS